MDTMTGRQLLPDEWKAFRRLRLEALTKEPDKFGAALSDERRYTKDKWRSWIYSVGKRVFGLFDGGELIGFTSVIPWSKDMIEISEAQNWNRGSFDHSAFCIGSYIRQGYRGLHLSKLLNDLRLDWAAMQPQFKRAVTAHRASNITAERIHSALGFRPLERQPFSWPDGTSEDVVICIMDLVDWRMKRCLPSYQKKIDSHPMRSSPHEFKNVEATNFQ